MVWLGFGLSLVALLGLARWSLWGAMVAGSLVLGAVALPWAELPRALARALMDPGVWALAGAVGLIPLIGAALERGGWMEPLVAQLPGGRRTVFALTPALMGLLPIPGGALLSAPILERVGGGQPADRAAANVWFRHTLLFFYPMSTALIAGAKLAGKDVWAVLPYQLPWAGLATALGAAFLLGPFRGPKPTLHNGPRNRFLFPLAVLLLAPGLDYLLKRTAPLPFPELATLVALLLSFALAAAGSLRWRELPPLVRKSGPWRFSLILLGMFLYLGVFQAAGLPQALASLQLPLLGVVLGLGLLMGLATGRQQAAVSVVLPIYMAAKGSIGLWGFSVLYQATYLGYLLSPLHPCLTVSAEYAGTTLWATWRKLLAPSLLLLAAVALAGAFLL